MIAQQMTLRDNSPSTQILQSMVGSGSIGTVPVRVVDEVCAKGDWLHLRPQQRVPLPLAEKVIVLREGMLAIDAMPTKGKLQVLDFLVAGDVVSAATVLPGSGVSFRAITRATLVYVDPPVVNRQVPAHDYWAFLVEQSLRQLARANIHQLLIGRLETEQRVASFLLSLALRNVRENNRKPCIELPMSRTDIANYLVINCDTLSRTMMKLCDCALIKRENRHALRVIDLDGLRKRSPLASLLSAAFEKTSVRQAIGVGRCGETNASPRSVHENHRLGPLVVPPAQVSRASAEYY